MKLFTYFKDKKNYKKFLRQTNRQIPEDLATEIFNILVNHAGYFKCDSNKQQFLYCQNEIPSKWNDHGGCTEYRFQGKLGFGGKFWNTNNKFYISSYPEDLNEDTKKIINIVNELLKPIYQKFLLLKK
jgi:hypothetical protein